MPLSDERLCGSTPADHRMPRTVSACSWNNASFVVSLSEASSSKRNTFICSCPCEDQNRHVHDEDKPLPSVLLSQGASTDWGFASS